MSRTAAIVADNLTVSYRGRAAVHHVSAEFPAGCMYAVAGPNGAGKSTLLKAVTGLIRCNGGRVDYRGLSRRDIAYLPQQSDIDRSQPISVFELAATGLWYETGFFRRVGSEQRRRVQAALARVGMDAFADRSIAELSDGQFQRVLIARMLVQDAKFLLLDEPFNAVDARTTAALLDILEQENRNGRAVIAVLHDHAQIREHFPRTLLIAREKVADGRTADVLCRDTLGRAADLAQAADDGRWCATV